ncbi:NUDIX domain-containing protein [Nocardioides sp. CFH 31398]|uniref:NUDIX domain-containing protein n=1 Tax=Nocardioides sp. CFH 31398 TaxID=2919579 RepID=UPI001F05B987|nr:NUDIX domain-containing protein [Nocardioides sp. CFH 31398]MCH1867568.1 NUDIX domain-containing protein [Nocardioides sp. CFH 31398]
MTHGRFVVVPAAYVFLLRPAEGGGEEVLLQLRRGTGFMDEHWAAGAAGHVERGETAYDAARREALEELGLTDVELRFELTMQRTRSGEPIDERVDFFFTSRSWTGEPRVMEANRSAGLRWCRLDALDSLPEPVVPHERYALASLGTGTAYLTHGFDDPQQRGASA